MDVWRSTLEFYDLDLEPGEVEMPEGSEVKEFIKNNLPSSSFLYTESFLKMPAMLFIILNEIGELYSFRWADAAFIRNINLKTAEDVSKKLWAIL